MLPACRVSAKALTDFSWSNDCAKHVRGASTRDLETGSRGVSRPDETDGTPAASVCGDYCTGGSNSDDCGTGEIRKERVTC